MQYTMQMTERKKWLFWLVTCIGVFTVLEVLCFLTLSVLNKEWYSYSEIARDQRAVLLMATEQLQEERYAKEPKINPHKMGKTVLHPYIGFVSDVESLPVGKGDRDPMEHYGFIHNSGWLVREKQENEVVIGLFGGSFAAHFGLREGRDRLEKWLLQHPDLQGKHITFASLAQGGLKQPQQLMTYTYLLSLGAQFDIIINLDGFNEIYLGPHENIPLGVFPIYPRSWYFLSQRLSPDAQRIAGAITLLKKKDSTITEAFHTPPLRSSFIASVLWKVVHTRISQKIIQYELALYSPEGTTNAFAVKGPFVDSSRDQYEYLADVWMQSSVQMERLAQANHTKYFHFLQPNQYVSGTKPIGKKEQKIALNLESNANRHVVKGYTYLQTMGKNLQEQGVQFTDLTSIFANHAEPLYVDTCCHISEAGDIIIADKIASVLLQQEHLLPQ